MQGRGVDFSAIVPRGSLVKGELAVPLVVFWKIAVYNISVIIIEI